MTDLAERQGEPDLWASPARPLSRPAKRPSRFESVAAVAVGCAWALGIFLLLAFVSWAL